jgi:proteasome assembly chaperone (PAC2) family protein
LREWLQQHHVVFTDYEGPTAFVTVLLAEAQARGLPAAALLGVAPNYIQGVPNPRVSHALLELFSEISGVPLKLGELDRAGRALTRQVDRLLMDQPQLREQVEKMLSLMNVAEETDATNAEAGEERESPSGNVELPSPQAVVSELEEFLKGLRQQDAGEE